VGGDIKNAHVRVAQQGIEIVGDARGWKIGVAPRAGALEIAGANRNDAEAIARIGVEMRRADAARADERDRRATVARHRRTIGQVRRFDLRRSLGDQRVVVR
jgi:hypothetical protein